MLFRKIKVDYLGLDKKSTIASDNLLVELPSVLK